MPTTPPLKEAYECQHSSAIATTQVHKQVHLQIIFIKFCKVFYAFQNKIQGMQHLQHLSLQKKWEIKNSIEIRNWKIKTSDTLH